MTAYVPDGRGDFREAEVTEWAMWHSDRPCFKLPFPDGGGVVGRDEIGAVTVSTVFLGIDHNFGGRGEPVLFETMIFGSGDPHLDDYQERYCSFAEALRGHQRAVALVKGSA